MPRVEITKPARDDLDAIWDYVANISVDRADGTIDLIDARCALYSTQPEMGVPAGQFGPGLRYFVVGSYVIFYKHEPDRLLVVRVLHGSRDLEKLFDE